MQANSLSLKHTLQYFSMFDGWNLDQVDQNQSDSPNQKGFIRTSSTRSSSTRPVLPDQFYQTSSTRTSSTRPVLPDQFDPTRSTRPVLQPRPDLSLYSLHTLLFTFSSPTLTPPHHSLLPTLTPPHYTLLLAPLLVILWMCYLCSKLLV